MKIFKSPNCEGRLYFDNLSGACGAEVEFDPEAQSFGPLDTPCANREVIGCNWKAEAPGDLCRSCRMNNKTPAVDVGDNRRDWAKTEQAKRWVLHNLGRWGWFSSVDVGARPVFQMLSEETAQGDAQVIMGHANGMITLNVTEADDVIRLQRRQQFGEAQRTIIGHIRHEMAHFLFLRLFDGPAEIGAFREVFGDESADYREALDRYYADGPQPEWPARFISAYASAHPHEDWAESCAHVMHLTDIVDSFYATGLKGAGAPNNEYDAYRERDPDALIRVGATLGVALNHVNRSMGVADVYPFVHTDAIRKKLAFTHLSLMESRPERRRGLFQRLGRLFRA